MQLKGCNQVLVEDLAYIECVPRHLEEVFAVNHDGHVRENSAAQHQQADVEVGEAQPIH